MNPPERELFRVALLRVLEANGTRFGLTAEALAALVVRFGFRPTADVTAEELTYLADKGLVVPAAKLISPENAAWRIAAAGRDFLAQA